LSISAAIVGGLILFLLTTQGTLFAQNRTFKSEKLNFSVTAVVEGLEHPWGMVFLPGGDILVTERGGHLRKISKGELLDQEIGGLPEIQQVGQGGLLGIALHPDFINNQLLYLSYAGTQEGRYSTEVLRGKLQGMTLVDVEIIFKALPKTKGGRHFGSRLLFAPDKTLYISLGDRGFKPSLCQKHPSQQPGNHLGSLVRINDDGSIPSDNPFVDRSDIKPEIYTFGNRNMQGMALHPETRKVWTHEHGPQGGDEINIMRPGVNYGWPVITYGVNYGTGTRICEGAHKQGMQQPIYKWVPSIAPSGMAFYDGDKLPAWKGNLFVGSLKFGELVRLELEGSEIIGEERLLNDAYGRIRDVVQGPDGYLYLLTDSAIGALLRLGVEK
jgi:glucose/arabinose dehydrogenase